MRLLSSSARSPVGSVRLLSSSPGQPVRRFAPAPADRFAWAAGYVPVKHTAVAGAVALLVFAACGGRTLSDDTTIGASPGGGPGTGVGAPGAGGPGGGGEPAVPGGGGGVPVPGGGGGGSGGGDPGGPPPPVPGIACGPTSCDAGTQECCVAFGGGPGGPGGPGGAQSCTPKGQCQGGLALSCSSAASCQGGQLCCIAFDGLSVRAQCQASCGSGPGPGPGGFPRQLCATDAECHGGDRCEPTPLGIKMCVRRRR